MKQLHLAPRFALPVDVAGEAIAILAKRGAGKTNTATVLVEELVDAGVQVVVVDPVGAWWGLRSSADGKTAGLPVPILGGQHGDVPLEPTAGALIADVVVDTGSSMLLDLSDFPSKASIARFVVDFGEHLYRRKGQSSSLLHLVLEEADSFAPQRGGADDARMRGAVEQIVRRGRSRGIGITMVTQRSAVLNKDVLSQADVLIAMRTTSPHDRKAIEAWIEAHDEERDEVVDSLSSLETGEAWFWNPERGLLERVKVRRRRTFDSSATPKAGERRVEPKQAAPIDLAELGEQITATAERAKASDPTALQKRVRELERELHNERQAHAVQAQQRLQEREQAVADALAEIERVEVPAISEQELVVLRNEISSIDEHVAELERAAGSIREAAAPLAAALERVERSTHGTTADRGRGAAPAARAPRDQPPPGRTEQAARHPRAREDRQVRPPAAAGELTVSAPQQRILNALAQLQTIGVDPVDKTQLALFAEASPKSSSYSNNLGALRTAGLIEYPQPSAVALTDAGFEISDAAAAPTSTDELHAYVARLVGAPKWRLLEVLIGQYPVSIPKDQLAEAAGASASSSSFSNNLGALRSLGLIDYPQPGTARAKPLLFLEG